MEALCALTSRCHSSAVAITALSLAMSSHPRNPR